MNFAIVGAGAMGTLFAALLKEGGCGVTLLEKHPERASMLVESGIRLEGVSGDRVVHVDVVVDPAKLPEVDVVIICTKSCDTYEAAKSISGIAGVPVLTLQNGLGNIEAIAEAVGIDNVLGGTTSHGANVVATGHTKHAGTGPTVIGEPSGPASDRVRQIAKAFTSAGIPTEVTDDLDGLLWSKLIVNVGINALGAILRVPNGELSSCTEGSRVMDQAASEAVEVARAEGVKLAFDDPVARVREVAEATAPNINSMLADILQGRMTEIDAINGKIVEKGAKLGIPTPVNEMLLLVVKALERTGEARVTLQGQV